MLHSDLLVFHTSNLYIAYAMPIWLKAVFGPMGILLQYYAHNTTTQTSVIEFFSDVEIANP